jgi:hypothetical protein
MIYHYQTIVRILITCKEPIPFWRHSPIIMICWHHIELYSERRRSRNRNHNLYLKTFYTPNKYEKNKFSKNIKINEQEFNPNGL